MISYVKPKSVYTVKIAVTLLSEKDRGPFTLSR